MNSRILALISHIARKLIASLIDLLPILAVILFFQVVVVQKAVPNVMNLIGGMALVIVGLSLFLQGLEQSLFPIGESMAYAFARKGSLFWLLTFAFCLGFGTTVAEPALIAVANEASDIASKAHIIGQTETDRNSYAFGLRITVALSVGFAILMGVLRILRGWSLLYLIVGGYICVLILTPFAPAEIIGIAYDSGGVTTSTITVPLVTALGVGLASAIKGRNPLIDGFGLIAFASLTPMVFVMAYGLLR